MEPTKNQSPKLDSIGKINAYICPKLHGTVTIDREHGTTPFMIACAECGEIATSQMYRVDQHLIPTYEWVKFSEEELRSATDEAYNNYDAQPAPKFEWTKDQIYEGMKSHQDKGGLSLRKIKASNGDAN